MNEVLRLSADQSPKARLEARLKKECPLAEPDGLHMIIQKFIEEGLYDQAESILDDARDRDQGEAQLLAQAALEGYFELGELERDSFDPEQIEAILETAQRAALGGIYHARREGAYAVNMWRTYLGDQGS